MKSPAASSEEFSERLKILLILHSAIFIIRAAIATAAAFFTFGFADKICYEYADNDQPGSNAYYY